MLMFYLIMAVITPIYLTPGFYYWTAGFIILFVLTAGRISDRINEWSLRDYLK